MVEATYLVMDCESTGIDVFEDRIVQFFLGWADAEGNLVDHREWLIDPGVPIPEEASNVHGFTETFLKEHGLPPKEALTQIRDELAGQVNLPWILFNANYDLSILDAELKRHGISQVFGQFVSNRVHVIDGIVIDRHKDKWRKGKRTLSAQADHYGVPYDPDELHNARTDVELTAKVTVAILNKYGTPSTAEQAEWREEWRKGFEEYLRRSDPSAVVEAGWPLRLKEEQ